MISCKFSDLSSLEDLPLMGMDDDGLVELEDAPATDASDDWSVERYAEACGLKDIEGLLRDIGISYE